MSTLLISFIVSLYAPMVCTVKYNPLLEGNTEEFNFNIPLLRMIYCTVHHFYGTVQYLFIKLLQRKLGRIWL